MVVSQAQASHLEQTFRSFPEDVKNFLEDRSVSPRDAEQEELWGKQGYLLFRANFIKKFGEGSFKEYEPYLREVFGADKDGI
jgi:hypothetical protein